MLLIVYLDKTKTLFITFNYGLILEDNNLSLTKPINSYD